MVEFAAPMLPTIPKVEAHASHESAVSDYCRRSQLFSLFPQWKDLMQTLIWGLNKVIMASLMDRIPRLSCTLTMRFGIN